MAYRTITFTELLDRVHAGRQEEWLTESLEGTDVSNLESNIVPVWGKNVIVGRFYLYKYFPKHFRTLPSYDQLPVTLVLEKYNGGFLGLNFHHYGRIGIYNNIVRNLLIGKIISRLQSDQRIIINYKLLQTILNNNRLLNKYWKVGVRRYLYDRIRSRLYDIDPSYWNYIVGLPIQSFRRGG